MNCPQCRQPLQKNHLADTDIEECPQCRGIWFDPEWQNLKAVLRLFKYRVFVENPQLNTLMRGLQKTLPL